MQLLRHYFLPLRSPDDDAAPEPDAVEPVAAADPVAAEAEPVVEPEPEPTPAPKPAVPAWALDRINEETNKRQAESARAEAAERRAADAEALAARLAKPGDTPAPTPKPAAPTDDAEVDRRAEYKLFLREVNAVAARGAEQFGNVWTDTLRALKAVGADGDNFVSQVLAAAPDKAHVLLNELGQNPERAASLAIMDPNRRMAELVKMAIAEKPAVEPKSAEPKPAEPKTAISRAPAPKPTLQARAPGPEIDPRTPEGNEKMSDAEFSNWWKANSKDGQMPKRQSA